MLDQLIQKDIVINGLEYVKSRDSRAADVLYQRFFDNAKATELATDYKLSVMRITQIQAKGMRLLRRYLELKKIYTFLEII
jgi:DNA-directed RNA polymerase sigma subunit (sigma70/sigma32)